MVGNDVKKEKRAEKLLSNMKISEQQGLKLLEASLKVSPCSFEGLWIEGH